MFEQGSYVGIATHDKALVAGAEALIEKRGLTKDQYEFQMLLGVEEKLGDRLLEAGHRLRIYVSLRRALVCLLHASPEGEPQDRALRPDELLQALVARHTVSVIFF